MNKENVKIIIKNWLTENGLEYDEDLRTFGFGKISISFNKKLDPVYQSAITKAEVRNMLRKIVIEQVQNNLEYATHNAIMHQINSQVFDSIDSQLEQIFKDRDWLMNVVIKNKAIGLNPYKFEFSFDEAYCNKETETVIYRIGAFAYITDMENDWQDSTALNGRSFDQAVKEDFHDKLKEDDFREEAWDDSEPSFSILWV